MYNMHRFSKLHIQAIFRLGVIMDQNSQTHSLPSSGTQKNKYLMQSWETYRLKSYSVNYWALTERNNNKTKQKKNIRFLCFWHVLKSPLQISHMRLHTTRSCKPCSVPSVWSAAGPEELSGWDIPVIRLQLKSAEGWGSRPQREPWKVHSLSGGQEPSSLLDTDMSSITMLPCLPPTTASRINWRAAEIIWS